MEAKIYNQNAGEAGKIKLAGNIFGLEWNGDLVHQVIVSMKSNIRVPVAHAKSRGEVSGGGRKPWVQKGTGRARHGSIRSPIWVGGGVAHGPLKEKKFSKKINKKMKRKALFTILSEKLKDNEILFLDKINLPQTKTKEASKIISNLSKIKGFDKLETKKENKAILVIAKKDSEITRSFRNISGMKISEINNINVLDLMNYKYLLIENPKEALKYWGK
ncbi:MAG: 50S ribosomal protein L4 [Patescibacteria group bacterium]